MLALAYRNACSEVLRAAVEDAVFSSHRHPEAVDFAVVQAAAVQYALSTSSLDPSVLLPDLASRCHTEAMRNMVLSVGNALSQHSRTEEAEFRIVEQLVAAERRPGSGMAFQIASVHMMPCVLWAACRHHADPRLAVQTAIDLGGDTDTTAAMVGAIMGAMHGEEWCADWAAQLENEAHGRDYALKLAEQLMELDIVE